MIRQHPNENNAPANRSGMKLTGFSILKEQDTPQHRFGSSYERPRTEAKRTLCET